MLQQDTLEDDYISDADILETYLRLLCSDGGASEHVDNEWISIKDLMENVRFLREQHSDNNVFM